MIRKIAFCLLSASVFINAHATRTYDLAPSLSIEYELAPNTPIVLTNYTIFTINALCNIETSDESNLIHAKVLKRSGELNGTVINTGDELDLTVHQGDKLSLTAKSAAQVELTNKGPHMVKALCKTV